LVGLGVLESLALACGCDVSSPFFMLGAPKVLLAVDGLWFVLVSICWRDLHPFWAILLLFLALFSPVFVLAFLLLLLWFLLLLVQLLDLGFQSENLFFFQGRGIPSLGLFVGLELVVGEEHERIWLDVGSFLVFVFLFADVGDEFLVRYCLVRLEEVRQEVIGCSPLAVKESIKSLT